MNKSDTGDVTGFGLYKEGDNRENGEEIDEDGMENEEYLEISSYHAHLNWTVINWCSSSYRASQW